MASELTEVSSVKIFDGDQKVFTHKSDACKCTMKFGIFLPPQVSVSQSDNNPVETRVTMSVLLSCNVNRYSIYVYDSLQFIPVDVMQMLQTSTGKLPVLYYLSGLTCTHENFVTKGGGQRLAAEKGMVIIRTLVMKFCVNS